VGSGEYGSAVSAAPLTGPAPRLRLARRSQRRLVAGVAGGIADHIGVPAAAVRIAFLLLAFAGGLGVVLYGTYWIVLPAPTSVSRPRWRWLEYVAGAALAAAALAAVAWTMPAGQLFVPSMLAVLGGALIWRQATETQRERWWQLSRTSLAAGAAGRIGRLRLAAGAMLVVAGGALALARANLSAVRDGLLAVGVTVVGVALLTGPWWMRMISDLGEERRQRIRAQEREELAARLHDSVLQTLALIQRNAAAPREVVRLARGQERELRTVLYGSKAPGGQLSDALRSLAAEVEDEYGVAVDAVVVGDASTDGRPGLAALVAASREALVNAAKHAEVSSVSLYAEVEADDIAVYVKDRGAGFDAASVDADRQGIRQSIVGRMERHRGTAKVRSRVGEGTEVEMRLPR
jgi:signal transduction histidine kinase